MKIKDVEIITTYEQKRIGKRGSGKRHGLSGPSAQDSKVWEPKKSSGLYSDSMGKYRLFCNFARGTGVVLLDKKAEAILNAADGSKKTKDILRDMSLEKGGKVSLGDAWALRKGSFKDALAKLESGKEILNPRGLTRIYKIFNRKGLVDPPEEAGVCHETLKIEPLEVYFYLTGEPGLAYQLPGRKAEAMGKEEGLRALDSIFDIAQKEGRKQIVFRFFVGKPEEYPFLKELVIYSKRKSIELFIDVRTFLFANFTLVSHSFIRDIRQMKMDLILSLDFPTKEADRVLDVFKKEKYAPFIISTITSLNLGKIEQLTSYFLDKRLNFVFGFIQKHSSVPKELVPSSEKLTEAMLKAYKIIEKKTPPYSLFQHILGRNFPLFDKAPKANYQPLVVTQEGIRKIDLGAKTKEECSDRRFKELCLKSSPIITSYFSFEEDSIKDWCEVYEKLIPQALKLEAMRLIKHQK